MLNFSKHSISSIPYFYPMTYSTHTCQLVVYGYPGMVYGFILPLLVIVYGILAPNATLIRFEQWL